MTVGQAKSWLSIGWLIAVGPLIVVLVLRQQNGFFGNDAKDVWSWFSQFVLPALTLLGGAWTVSTSPNDQKAIGNKFVFSVAVTLSIFYLALLYLVVASQVGSAQPVNQLKDSGLFLGIIQALVIGVLGKFFIENSR
jgi:cellobiose-specific phosphotransferase system component IIC